MYRPGSYAERGLGFGGVTPTQPTAALVQAHNSKSLQNRQQKLTARHQTRYSVTSWRQFDAATRQLKYEKSS